MGKKELDIDIKCLQDQVKGIQEKIDNQRNLLLKHGDVLTLLLEHFEMEYHPSKKKIIPATLVVKESKNVENVDGCVEKGVNNDLWWL